MWELVRFYRDFSDYRIECHYRVCGRVYVPRQATCKYDDQDIWIYDDGASTLFAQLI
jgi:uncharacterized OB-fold protein